MNFYKYKNLDKKQQVPVDTIFKDRISAHQTQVTCFERYDFVIWIYESCLKTTCRSSLPFKGISVFLSI